MTYDDAIARLRELVGLMEDGGAALETSVKYYQEGVELAAFCSEYLKNARGVIRRVSGVSGNEEEMEEAEEIEEMEEGESL